MSWKTSMTATKKKDAEGEVEELLKTVEDDMLLKLSLNSHMSRVSPNYLDFDLDRRLRALKSPPSSSSSPIPPPPSSTTSAVDPPPRLSSPENPADPELTAVLGDDLAARFAALKASLSSPQSVGTIVSEGGHRDKEDEDEDDEVERLIQWAKDAARLDPSPPSDDDDDVDDDDDDEEDDRRSTK